MCLGPEKVARAVFEGMGTQVCVGICVYDKICLCVYICVCMICVWCHNRHPPPPPPAPAPKQWAARPSIWTTSSRWPQFGPFSFVDPRKRLNGGEWPTVWAVVSAPRWWLTIRAMPVPWSIIRGGFTVFPISPPGRTLCRPTRSSGCWSKGRCRAR